MSEQPKTIVIISHSVKVGESIYQPLVDNLLVLLDKYRVLVVQHPLNNDFKSRYFFCENKIGIVPGILQFGVFRYASEIIATALLVKRKVPGKAIVIALNPANVLSGFIYKSLFNKQALIINYIPDYDAKRFHNIVVNKIYLYVEKKMTLVADYVWCCSEGVYKLKKKIRKKGLFLIKNYPPKSLIKRGLNDKEIIGMIGFLDDYYLMNEIFDFVCMIRERKKLRRDFLQIIGGGRMEDLYKKAVEDSKIKNMVKFNGYMDKKDAFKLLARLGVGLCIYADDCSFNEYRDSVKVREYIALGLPVITTNNHSTAHDVSKNELGIVIKANSKKLAEDLLKAYMKIEKNYNYYRNNCIAYYEKDYTNKDIIIKCLDNMISEV